MTGTKIPASPKSSDSPMISPLQFPTSVATTGLRAAKLSRMVSGCPSLMLVRSMTSIFP